MKLINQVRLEYRQGTSDKVYEVDLCEVGAGRYVVNFRYGRRGTTLRDGTKTAAPVSREKAESIYDKLVDSKRREGYVDAGADAPPTPTRTTRRPAGRPPAPEPAAPSPRRKLARHGPVRFARLEFRQGRSDKVYEIDLTEAGGGLYEVNTRYGRRGGALRAGVVINPMPRDEADATFDNLVESKVAEGYVNVSSGGQEATPPPVPPGQPRAQAAAGPVGRAQGVLNRLREGFEGGRRTPDRRHWRLSRAIWRAGELTLREAEPLLLTLLEQVRERKELRGRKRRQFSRDEIVELLGERTVRFPRGRWGFVEWSETFAPPEDLLLYVLAWSLGRCGSAASAPALRGLREETWAPIARIATASLLRVLEGTERTELVEELTAGLPEPLANLCRTGPAEAFGQALEAHLARPDADRAGVLDALYLIDTEHVRPAVLHLLRTVGLRTAYFQPVRHIFKIAEQRRDAEVFGILGHRFETAARPAPDVRPEVSANRYSDGRLSKSVAHLIPFKDSTRLYLRLRTWRTLRRLGALGDPDYVRLAVGVLAPFSDADAHQGDFDRYWAFGQILHGNSQRYLALPRKGHFVRRTTRSRGRVAGNEIPFRELWRAAPQELLTLIERSRCQPVHEFAVGILRDCPDFCRQLDVAALVRLLAAPYEVTMELGLDLAIQRSDPDPPENDLVLALANCALERARAQAREWIDAQRGRFTADASFLAALAGSPRADTRAFARELLRQTAFPTAAAQGLVGRLVAVLRSFGAGEGERARDTAHTLQLVFAAHLRQIGPDVIRDLLDHPLPEVRQLAGEIVLAHDTLAHRPPEDVLLRLLQDADPSVRGAGVRLLGQLPEATLKESLDLLVGLSRHELTDFRDNIRPVVKRLADADPDFGRRIARRLVEALLVPGAPEGVPSHTARVLREDLREHLKDVPPELVWKLLQARSPVAQEVGGMLLTTNVRAEDLRLGEVVKLASHDILAVREAAWEMCRRSLDRLRADMDTAAQLVDAKWEDSRQFAFGLLRDSFSPGELTPAVLVSLCDSVRPDVQQFGREMITRLFAETDGPEYAVKLSEHPSPAMQMFAANFLEQYAGDSPERLRELTFYFQSVLSRVNQGAVAKERVFRFLKKAAEAGEESAWVVAGILGRQSATASIRDRARAIEVLTQIHALYPAVEMPLKVLPVEVRGGV